MYDFRRLNATMLIFFFIFASASWNGLDLQPKGFDSPHDAGLKLNIKMIVYENKRNVSVDYIYQKCSVNP